MGRSAHGLSPVTGENPYGEALAWCGTPRGLERQGGYQKPPLLFLG
jgi:hypothetical protein